MTTSNELEIIKIIEENGWNVKEIAQKLLEERGMNEQLIEKNQELKDTIKELREEENEIAD